MKTFFIISFASVFLLNSCKNANTKPIAEESPEISSKTENYNTAFIGTYTKKEGHVNGQANGIYTIYQNPENGSLEMGKTVAEITNPSFVEASQDGEYLYAVSELGEKDAPSGYIYSFKIGEDGSLSELGKLSTEGFAPCHIAIDGSGDYVFVSNYLGGVVMMYRRNPDGSLEKQQRLDIGDPQESNTHSVTIPSDNKHIYVADLGQDKIWIFDFDASEGKLLPNEQAFVALEEGSGPRHLTFSKDQDFIYSANELNSSVSVFEVLDKGGLKFIQNLSTLPKDYTENNSVADIHVHPSGNFLYVSNRGHNSIAAYHIDEGKLELKTFTGTLGETPRNFSFGPQGEFMYVANQDSNNISIFEVDRETGSLKSQMETLEAKTPVCIEFL